jgi:hypothetical protein
MLPQPTGILRVGAEYRVEGITLIDSTKARD